MDLQSTALATWPRRLVWFFASRPQVRGCRSPRPKGQDAEQRDSFLASHWKNTTNGPRDEHCQCGTEGKSAIRGCDLQGNHIKDSAETKEARWVYRGLCMSGRRSSSDENQKKIASWRSPLSWRSWPAVPLAANDNMPSADQSPDFIMVGLATELSHWPTESLAH